MRILFSPAYRVLALALSLLIGALCTPADVLSMLMVATPLYLVYLCACCAVWRKGDGQFDELSQAK